MKPLSIRARESIKTGLAMVVAIAISLRMDFLEPEWAGFAVAMISLDAAGQSLNKAAMRMFGTLVAFVASLTFAGLFPLMMERSMQARFLIPMAVSLAFGVLFATFITLILVPSSYMILEDLRRLAGRQASFRSGRPAPATPSAPPES